jgi:hypothetical protein
VDHSTRMNINRPTLQIDFSETQHLTDIVILCYSTIYTTAARLSHPASHIPSAKSVVIQVFICSSTTIQFSNSTRLRRPILSRKPRRTSQFAPASNNLLLLLLARPPISNHTLPQSNFQNLRLQLPIKSLLDLFFQALERVAWDTEDCCCGFEDQPADPFAEAFAEAGEAFFLRTPVGVVGEAGYAVEHVVDKSLVLLAREKYKMGT